VVRSDELPVGDAEHSGIRRVTAGRTDVLLARLGSGEVVAFGTVCPHQLTNLEEASLWGDNLRCPRHQYLYDLRSGENILPSREARPDNLWKLKPGYLPVYRVEERDGWVWVDESPLPPPGGYDRAKERRPAETMGAGPGRGESDAAPPPADAAGPVEHPPKTLRVRHGAAFELRLPTTPRPGFTWKVTVSAGLSVLEEAFLPGTPARQRIRVRARKVGDATLKCAYARPWDTTPAEVRSYVVKVVPGETIA
jgi:nitrite reductase/ring-hydroxylating ferredoxin subunit/predicted secreted protein